MQTNKTSAEWYPTMKAAAEVHENYLIVLKLCTTAFFFACLPWKYFNIKLKAKGAVTDTLMDAHVAQHSKIFFEKLD